MVFYYELFASILGVSMKEGSSCESGKQLTPEQGLIKFEKDLRKFAADNLAKHLALNNKQILIDFVSELQARGSKIIDEQTQKLETMKRETLEDSEKALEVLKYIQQQHEILYKVVQDITAIIAKRK